MGVFEKYTDDRIKIQIIKEEKIVLNNLGLVDDNNAAPKYYFADENGNRLSKSYYSIEKLDDIHYKVSDLDFMFSLGFDEWKKCYDNELKEEDIFYFKFHYGVVAVFDNKLEEIIPVVYKDIRKTNSNVVIIENDESYKIVLDSNGKRSTERINEKLGCINLDLDSKNYGMIIIPPIMDRIEDFDLEYKGYAKVYLDGTEGYLSKDIDVDTYKEIMNLYCLLKNKQINYKTYINNLPDAVSKILLSEKRIKELKKGKIKKIK